MRVKDRHERDFVIQPTSEEVITDIARQELRSYRALPKNFYHIQTKFRDERRPRFGVMRGREFTMKDAYSFDRDLDAARMQLRPDVRRLRAHLRAHGSRLSRRRGRQRRDRRHPFARVPGDRRHRRGCDRLQHRLGLRSQHRARRGGCAGRAARRSFPAAEEDADAWQEHVRGRRRAARPAARADREVDRARHRRDRRRPSAARRADDLAPARPRRPLAERDQGEQGRGPRSRLSLRDRGRDRVDLRLPPGLPRADRAAPAGAPGRRSRGRGDERLRLRRERRRLPLHRYQLGPRPARARRRRRHPQRRRRRSLARWQAACSRSSAASKSATCSCSARTTARA